MKMGPDRPACLLAALACMTPAAGIAATIASPREPQARVDDRSVLHPVAIVLATIVLLLAVVLVAGRIPRRISIVVLIGFCVLLGGGAILDEAQTAIAVSQ
jgi:hypothetical protein